MVIKKCAVCGREFDAKGSDKSCSKECSKERIRQRNRQYRQDNEEYCKQYRRQYYQDNKKHIKQHNKQYYKDNQEHILQQKKQYYKDNQEYYKQYRQDNKEYFQKYVTQHIKKQINELVQQYDGDLEKILENIPSKWHLREAQMRVWFNESYYDGIIAKIESTPCCEVTGEKDNLVIHHLWSFNTHPQYGNDPANMVRITEKVHKAFHDEYGYGDNTPEQWEEFVNNYLHN